MPNKVTRAEARRRGNVLQRMQPSGRDIEAVRVAGVRAQVGAEYSAAVWMNRPQLGMRACLPGRNGALPDVANAVRYVADGPRLRQPHDTACAVAVVGGQQV